MITVETVPLIEKKEVYYVVVPKLCLMSAVCFKVSLAISADGAAFGTNPWSFDFL